MNEIRATYQEPSTVSEATTRLKMVLSKFAGEKGDLKQILASHNFKFEELLTLLESSLNAQKEELDRLRKDTRKLTRRIDALSQCQLL